MASRPPRSPFPDRTNLPPDYFDLKRTAMGQGGRVDNAINTARGWWGDRTHDLGRYRSEYGWSNPMGGYVRAGLENAGMPAGQAQVGERIAAGGLSSVVGLTALAAAYDGLFGESQSPGTMPIVVSAGPAQVG